MESNHHGLEMPIESPDSEAVEPQTADSEEFVSDREPQAPNSDPVPPAGRMLEDLVDALPGIVFIKDLEGRILAVNRRYEETTGTSRSHILGKTDFDLFPGEQSRRYRTQDEKVIETGQPAQFEEIVDLPEGGERTLLVDKFLLRDAAGRPYAVCGVTTDITEHKRIDQALQESEARFRTLVETTSDWIWEVDSANRYSYSSPKVKDLLGYEPDEILGKSPFDLMPQGEARRVAAVVEPAMAAARPFSRVENFNRHKDGRLLLLETSGVPILDAEGALRGYRGIDRNITARKEAEQELHHTLERLRLHIENSPLAVIEWGPDFRLSSWNVSAERMFGWKAEEVIGKRISDLRWVHEDDVAQVEGVSTSLCSGCTGGQFSSNRNYRKDGSIIHCEWYNSTLVDRSGRLISILALVLDVTERKHIEEELREAREELERRVRERTAELSHTIEDLNREVTQRRVAEEALRQRSDELRRLAAELTLAEQQERQRMSQVLHDGLQQILVGAKFRLAFLEKSADPPMALEVARAVGALIDESIDVSRSLSVELSPPALRMGLVPALEWLTEWMGEKHGLRVELDVPRLPVSLTEEATTLLFQAVRELLLNVRKHAGVDSARVEVAEPDRMLRIVVSDKGRGFEPQRVRFQGNRALGIGLFAITERLNRLDGAFEFESEPGLGSRFTLTAPLDRISRQPVHSRA